MGLNVIIACHAHRVQSYMMRGEESRDLQWWMREHAICFEHGNVSVYRDCDGNLPDYSEEWKYEDRPLARAEGRA